MGPASSAIEAAARALDDAETHLYSADAGLPALREALAAALRQTDITAAEIIITAGGNQAFMLAAMTAIDAGDEVILPSPHFVNHQMAIEAIGAIPIEAPLSETHGFRPRWRDIAPHLTAKTRAVVLCSPSNPTGAVVEPAELERIAAELRRRDLLLICDETYHRLIYGAAEHRSGAALPGWRDHVIVCGTFSKSFGMTGWRIGYMLASSEVCDQAIKIQDAMIICAPVIAQRAVLAAIAHDWNYPLRFLPELEDRRAALAPASTAFPAGTGLRRRAASSRSCASTAAATRTRSPRASSTRRTWSPFPDGCSAAPVKATCGWPTASPRRRNSTRRAAASRASPAASTSPA